MRSLRTLLAVVCVLLVMLFGTVQAAHNHLDCADSHANCPLCATAHVTIHLSQTQAPAPAARVIALLETPPPAEGSSRLSVFSHFTRPPPSLNTPA